jgi:hypothetical protein
VHTAEEDNAAIVQQAHRVTRETQTPRLNYGSWCQIVRSKHISYQHVKDASMVVGQVSHAQVCPTLLQLV